MNKQIYVDVHVHTHLSPCGKPQATAAAMIRRAQEKGIQAIGFADHFTPAPVPGCPFYDHQRQDILDRLRNEIDQVSPRAAIETLVGVDWLSAWLQEDCIRQSSIPFWIDCLDHGVWVIF